MNVNFGMAINSKSSKRNYIMKNIIKELITSGDQSNMKFAESLFDSAIEEIQSFIPRGQFIKVLVFKEGMILCLRNSYPQIHEPYEIYNENVTNVEYESIPELLKQFIKNSESRDESVSKYKRFMINILKK